MAKGKSGVVKSKPVVTSINSFKVNMTTGEKEEWLKNTTSKKLSDEEARDTIEAAEWYSVDGYDKIHNGEAQEAAALIDAMIEDSNTPVYGKTQYRGLHISAENPNLNGMDPKEWVESIIESGVWREPGVSSFSASKKTAMDFGHFHFGIPGEVNILITNHGHTKGMPFKHISKIPHEDEVLQSSKTMLQGLVITGYHTNKAGNEFYIEVDDSIPVKSVKGKKQSLEDLWEPFN